MLHLKKRGHLGHFIRIMVSSQVDTSCMSFFRCVYNLIYTLACGTKYIVQVGDSDPNDDESADGQMDASDPVVMDKTDKGSWFV